MPLLGSASKDYELTPNQFLFLNGLASEILGKSRIRRAIDIAEVINSFPVGEPDLWHAPVEPCARRL